MNARRAARELAVLSLTRFSAVDDPGDVSLEELLEQAVRLLASEAEEELRVAGASLEQAEVAWEGLWRVLVDGDGTVPPAKQAELHDLMIRALSAAQIAINVTGQAFQVPLIRALAETEEVRRFALDHIRLFRDHPQEIDRLIDEATRNWTVERLAMVDRNILRLALTELLYRLDIPTEVAIDEAVELAKKYGSEESPRFVNGVLGGLVPLVQRRRAEKGRNKVS